MRNSKNQKSQSAMEYLMTYGWAVLIVTIVLVALFQLGVFGNNFTPRASPGSCEIFRASSGITGTISLEGECQSTPPQYVAMLNGQTSYISVPSATSLNPASFTLSFWINPAQLYTGFQRVISKDIKSTSPNAGWTVLWGNNGKLYVASWNGAGTEQDTQQVTMYQNTWQFITVEYNGVCTSIYYNGAFVSCSSSLTLNSAINQPLIIGGGDSDSLTSFTQGQMANVQFYNVTLTNAEVQALYVEGIGGIPVVPQSTVGWWPLNSNTKDYSGVGNNGAGTSLTFSSSYLQQYTPP